MQKPIEHEVIMENRTLLMYESMNKICRESANYLLDNNLQGRIKIPGYIYDNVHAPVVYMGFEVVRGEL